MTRWPWKRGNPPCPVCQSRRTKPHAQRLHLWWCDNGPHWWIAYDKDGKHVKRTSQPEAQ